VGGVAGHFFDTEVRFRGARYLGEVRDREHLGALGQATERLRDGMRRATADARIDLVEDDRRLAGARVGDGAKREGDTGELSARGSLGDRRERQARVRPGEERDSVSPARPVLAIRDLGLELPVAHPEALQLGRDGLAESYRRGAARLREPTREVGCPALRIR